MGVFEGLWEKAGRLGAKLASAVREGGSVLILFKRDTDGIAASSIAAKVILHAGGRFTIRGIGASKGEAPEELEEARHDLYVFCGLDEDEVKGLGEAVGEKWIAFSDQLSPKERLESSRVLNPWQFGFEGGREISSAGVAYLSALSIDDAHASMAWLPVVSSLSAALDLEGARELKGLNRRIVDDAVNAQRLTLAKTLILYSGGFKPLHASLSSTTLPFIPWLLGDRETCLAALSSAGVNLREGGRWRTVNDLSKEEEKRVVEAIKPHLTHPSAKRDYSQLLFGETYTLPREDENSPLRDAREFADLLNACAALGRAEVGVSVCLGDREQALLEGEAALSEYRRRLTSYVREVLENEDRRVEWEGVTSISVADIVDEGFTMPLLTVLSAIPQLHERLLLLETRGPEGWATLVLRGSLGLHPSPNLGLLIHDAAVKCDGLGGGNASNGWAKIPLPQLQNFIRRAAALGARTS